MRLIYAFIEAAPFTVGGEYTEGDTCAFEPIYCALLAGGNGFEVSLEK